MRLGAANSLWELKLRLVEALGVHPANALVHVLRGGRWALLERDDASLAGARALAAFPLPPTPFHWFCEAVAQQCAPAASARILSRIGGCWVI